MKEHSLILPDNCFFNDQGIVFLNSSIWYFIVFSATDKFLLRDKKSEKEYKYNLSLSLSASRENENGLLHGYSVYVSKSTKPPPSEIKGKYMRKYN